MNSEKVDLEILVGYSQDPLLFDAQDDDVWYHAPEEAGDFFHLSEGLVRELEAWDREYQGTLNIDDPRESGFPSENAYHTWLNKGRELASRIKRESPNVGRVGYQARGEYQRGECVF
ncbi:hypothetical protein [Actinoalloteichus fjordicus]|uniref:Uncharacterized protein n=1 Tax=Actinoalloteichus fjordicus TaxID=1612552 RepID=A0AAC9LDX5_9PSEU|nr:hypothetical protein [Actinoalloteichus fjordicus]APU16063.1 hypothetical protein UA74_20190 [Actinoalloteichus fjordicus]